MATQDVGIDPITYEVISHRLWSINEEGSTTIAHASGSPVVQATDYNFALYAPNGWLGMWLLKWGIQVAFTPLGIVVALTFIGLPFVVRTLQPVLEDLDKEVEQAAATLGASAAQAFARVILPALWPALLTGFALAFARAVGEYGSVIFIAGNMPMKSEIAPLLIVTKLEQYDYAGATAIAVVMLVVSFTVMLGINALQHWALSRHAAR